MTNLNLLGRTIGRFEILSELGRGGMAVVYRARQSAPNRIVALKVLPPELSYDGSYIARFRQEADSAAALEHPHIVPIYAVDETDGLHYIAMKFVQGDTLKEVAQREGAMSVARAAELLSQVAEALDYAHSQGVIHRDIKPSNIMLTESGWVYLTDFGLARGTGGSAGLTMAGTVMGTPEYMSPEQAQGLATIGTATDIYALGVVLYELLTGRFPFSADTPMAMLAARLLEQPRPPRDHRPELPLAVEDVVMRALARKPEARFPSAGALVQALRAAGNANPGAPTLRPPYEQPPMIAPSPPAGVAPISSPRATPSPYVIPQGPSPVAVPSPQRLATPLPPAMPLYGQAPLPVPPSLPPAAPAPARKGRMGRGVLMGGMALIVVATLACVGLYAFGRISARRELEAQQQARAALVAQGDAALIKADFDGTERAIAQLLKLDANNAAALTGRAMLRDLQGNYPDAIAQARTAIKAGGGGTTEAVAQAVLADSMANAGKYDEALAAARAAQKLDAELGLAYAAEANALAHQASDRSESDLADKALAILDTARDKLGNDAPLPKALANSLIGDTLLAAHDVSADDDKLDSADEAYKSALDISSQPLFHVGAGYAELARKKYAAARDAFNAALDGHDDYALAHVGLGWADFADPDATFDQALATFDKALDLDGGNAWAHYAKGRALFAQSKYEDARAAFEEADKLLPDNAEIITWLGRVHQRYAFASDDTAVRKDAYAQADSLLRRAIELNDRQKIAFTQLGWTLQYQEKYDESLEFFQKAIAIDPQQDEAFNGLGWSLYNLNKYAEAEEKFREAVRIAPTYENAFYGLGQTLEKLKRVDDAKQAYRDALKANPDYKLAQEALDHLK